VPDFAHTLKRDKQVFFAFENLEIAVPGDYKPKDFTCVTRKNNIANAP
jgi:hypothetical protein